jgi:hypothetical protein
MKLDRMVVIVHCTLTEYQFGSTGIRFKKLRDCHDSKLGKQEKVHLRGIWVQGHMSLSERTTPRKWIDGQPDMMGQH